MDFRYLALFSEFFALYQVPVVQQISAELVPHFLL